MIEKAKRYPAQARAGGQEDTVQILIRVDRSGRILGGTVIKSKGYAALDKEAIDLLRRIRKIEPPPDSIRGAVIERIVGLRFSL
jgi:protein TonB